MTFRVVWSEKASAFSRREQGPGWGGCPGWSPEILLHSPYDHGTAASDGYETHHDLHSL